MLSLDFTKPLIMGILNLTPDSFSDGGEFVDPGKAIDRLEKMLEEGADIIDIGAESTFGPESMISAEEEWARLEPVLRKIDYGKVFVSVDTYKAEVARRAIEMDVQMINDVTALRGDPKIIETLVDLHPYVCLMYSADPTPYASRTEHKYEDVMDTVKNFLQQAVAKSFSGGYPKDRIIIDPGLGFFLSSDPAVSWEVIDRLGELKELGFPILIGPSMKSFLGGEISERANKSLEAAKKCIKNGADVLRMHEVKDAKNKA